MNKHGHSPEVQPARLMAGEGLSPSQEHWSPALQISSL